MTDKERSRSDWLVWVGVGLMLVAAYVGAYFSCVHIISPYAGSRRPAYYLPFCNHHDLIDDALDMIFYPVHRVDRLARPVIWRTDRNSN